LGKASKQAQGAHLFWWGSGPSTHGEVDRSLKFHCFDLAAAEDFSVYASKPFELNERKESYGVIADSFYR
jgi:hypothetical protein